MNYQFLIVNRPFYQFFADIAAFVIAYGGAVQEIGKEEKAEDEEEDE